MYMMILRILKAATFLTVVLGSSSAAAQDWEWRYGTPKMKFFTQAQSQWCWAATSKAVILHHRNKSVGMCNLASYYIYGEAGNYCCNSTRAASSKCNKPFNVYKPLQKFNIYGGWTEGAPDENRGKQEMRNGNPMIISIGWTNSDGSFKPIGHAVIVYGIGKPRGYSMMGNTMYVWDPGRNRGKKSMTETELRRAYSNKGKWRATIFSKKAN